MKQAQICVVHTQAGPWQASTRNTRTCTICNAKAHKLSFIPSQLGSFHLLQNRTHNYANGKQLCCDYVGLRSTAATTYHPIENERAIWLYSNATNGTGCFIGCNNIDHEVLQWDNEASICVFKLPWLDDPWNDEGKEKLTKPSEASCTAITKDPTNQWEWNVVDCDEELNISCGSGNELAVTTKSIKSQNIKTFYFITMELMTYYTPNSHRKPNYLTLHVIQSIKIRCMKLRSQNALDEPNR